MSCRVDCFAWSGVIHLCRCHVIVQHPGGGRSPLGSPGCVCALVLDSETLVIGGSRHWSHWEEVASYDTRERSIQGTPLPPGGFLKNEDFALTLQSVRVP